MRAQVKDAYQWPNMPHRLWTLIHVLCWIKSMGFAWNVPDIRSDAFSDVDGATLGRMTMEEFQQKDPLYGADLYTAFQQVKYRWENKSPRLWDPIDVAWWIQCLAFAWNVRDIRADAFGDVDAAILGRMSMEEFQLKDPFYGGDLYMAFQQVKYTSTQYQQANIQAEHAPNEYQYQVYDAYQWQKKSPRLWNPIDVAWNVDDVRADAFGDANGTKLGRMSMEEGQQKDPFYGGDLYMAFQQVNYTSTQYQQSNILEGSAPNEYQYQALPSIGRYIWDNNITFDKSGKFPSLTLPPFESESPPPSPSSDATSTVSTTQGGRGRSKGLLWEFLLRLLLDPETNPSIIKWEDQANGIFIIVKSKDVAKLWGIQKANPTMTYEKMSRALRDYYKKQILGRIDNRRLVYKFGPQSRGWRL